MDSKNTDRVLDLILGQLEKLNQAQERLSEEIQKTNIELAKIAGLKHAVSDFKSWKDSIEEAVNVNDLVKMKEFYNKYQTIDAEVTDLFRITKELRDSSDDYVKFKTKTMTVIAVVSFLFATAMTIIGIVMR